MQWPNWGEMFKWLANNIGPAIPYIFSGGFSVWALVLKMKGDAQKRAADTDRENREEARRKQEQTDRENTQIRLDSEKSKAQAYEKAERLLEEERKRSQELLAEKIHHMNGKLQILENQLGVAQIVKERDDVKIEHLESRLQEVREKLAERERDLNDANKTITGYEKRETAMAKELQRLQEELNTIKAMRKP